MERQWRYFIVLNGKKMYLKQYVIENNHHHTPLTKEALKVSTSQVREKYDEALPEYTREMVKKGE